MALHDTKPGDGSTSLNHLNINMSNKHGWKPSWESSGEDHLSLEGRELDHGGIGLNMIHHATSAATSMTDTSPTQTCVDELLVQSGKGSRSCSHSHGKKGSGDFDGVGCL